MCTFLSHYFTCGLTKSHWAYCKNAKVIVEELPELPQLVVEAETVARFEQSLAIRPATPSNPDQLADIAQQARREAPLSEEHQLSGSRNFQANDLSNGISLPQVPLSTGPVAGYFAPPTPPPRIRGWTLQRTPCNKRKFRINQERARQCRDPLCEFNRFPRRWTCCECGQGPNRTAECLKPLSDGTLCTHHVCHFCEHRGKL
jgi:hypothetical protein